MKGQPCHHMQQHSCPPCDKDTVICLVFCQPRRRETPADVGCGCCSFCCEAAICWHSATLNHWAAAVYFGAHSLALCSLCSAAGVSQQAGHYTASNDITFCSLSRSPSSNLLISRATGLLKKIWNQPVNSISWVWKDGAFEMLYDNSILIFINIVLRATLNYNSIYTHLCYFCPYSHFSLHSRVPYGSIFPGV